MHHWTKSGDFYVDAVSGDDTNTGSYDAPFASIQQALDTLDDIIAISKNYRIIIAPGAYKEAVSQQFSEGDNIQIHLIADGYVQMKGTAEHTSFDLRAPGGLNQLMNIYIEGITFADYSYHLTHDNNHVRYHTIKCTFVGGAIGPYTNGAAMHYKSNFIHSAINPFNVDFNHCVLVGVTHTGNPFITMRNSDIDSTSSLNLVHTTNCNFRGSRNGGTSTNDVDNTDPNPLFANADELDFTLLAGSPNIGVGINGANIGSQDAALVTANGSAGDPLSPSPGTDGAVFTDIDSSDGFVVANGANSGKVVTRVIDFGTPKVLGPLNFHWAGEFDPELIFSTDAVAVDATNAPVKYPFSYKMKWADNASNLSSAVFHHFLINRQPQFDFINSAGNAQQLFDSANARSIKAQFCQIEFEMKPQPV